jgi:hypothetical protein
MKGCLLLHLRRSRVRSHRKNRRRSERSKKRYEGKEEVEQTTTESEEARVSEPNRSKRGWVRRRLQSSVDVVRDAIWVGVVGRFVTRVDLVVLFSIPVRTYLDLLLAIVSTVLASGRGRGW